MLIPEIDSPGHLRPIGLNPTFKDIILQGCHGSGDPYNA